VCSWQLRWSACLGRWPGQTRAHRAWRSRDWPVSRLLVLVILRPLARRFPVRLPWTQLYRQVRIPLSTPIRVRALFRPRIRGGMTRLRVRTGSCEIGVVGCVGARVCCGCGRVSRGSARKSSRFGWVLIAQLCRRRELASTNSSRRLHSWRSSAHRYWAGVVGWHGRRRRREIRVAGRLC
jgi:hypothetical protein